MRLDELVVEDFRKLKGRHVVRPAPAGITVVSGDNEEGKSTLLDALKRAFFMKHNTTGAEREAIQPLGLATTPSIQVAFTIGGCGWRLEKSFRRGGVRLSGPQGTLEGDAAEHALARLLAFEWPGRGAAKIEQMGLAGLFWVEQGTSFEPEQKPSAAALRSLEPALAEQVSVLARGERAPRLIAEIRRKGQQYWTDSKGQPRGELRELEKICTDLHAEYQNLLEAERQIEALLDALAHRIDKRRIWIEADHLGRAKAEVERTRSTLARIRALEEAERVQRLECDKAEVELRELTERLARRRALMAQIDAKSAEKAVVLREAEHGSHQLELARRELLAADREEALGREAVVRAEEEHKRAASSLERRGLERQAKVLEQSLAAAAETSRAAALHRAAAAAEALSEEMLGLLDRQEAERREIAAAMRAVATRLVLAPVGGDPRTVRLDDAPIAADATLELTAPATLLIEGFGRIEVIPGGDRLDGLRRRLAEIERSIGTSLRQFDLADIAQARQRLAQKQQHERNAVAAQASLADLLKALDVADLASLEAALARVRLRLEALADARACHQHASDDALEAGLQTAERALTAARDALAAQARKRERASQRKAELDAEVRHAAFACERIEAEIASCLVELAGEREAFTDQKLDELLASARETAGEKRRTLAVMRQDLADLTPQTARLEAEQAERRLAQLEAEAQEHDRAVDRLEAELQGAGGRGIGDARAVVEGRLALAQRRHARLLAEAQAWRLLQETVDSVERTRQDAMAGPLRRRIEPYLRELVGEARLEFDPAGLAVQGLRRGDRAEPFAVLSVGTREQLAVLVRLVMADLLLEAGGECPPLILDDALVYADAVRLARMKSILARAARHQQIIVLTCRKEDYLGLDGRYITLEACREEGQF